MAAERRFGPGAVLFREGEPSAEVFRIRSGEAEVLKEPEGGGRPAVLGTVRAGEFVGEMGVLQEQPRSATVRAVGEVTAEAIPGDEFLRRISRDSETALQLLVRLSERLRHVNQRLARAAAAAAPAAASAEPGQRGAVTPNVAPAPAADSIRIFTASDALAGALPPEGLRVERFPFVVGRRPEAGDPALEEAEVHLQLPDARPYRLSRAHLAIRRHGRGYVVSDLGSVLGTAVNGRFLG
ncbi:MAG TPA: cyclic nucleotide-binding domain-containing protein, partial [Geminicoccaceae bacterium]|nr:cyclic nucleotide-binding domain-containing protein [Geminicoccaceae bacterium]